MAKIAERGRVIVGVNQNSYRFGFRDPVSGEIVGFEIGLAREIARAIFGDPNRVQFTTTNVPDRINFLKEHKVDIVINTFTITCARLQEVAFSTEYLTIGPRLLVKRGSKYQSIDDLGGRKVCASKGGAPLLAVQQAASRPIPVGAENTADCLVMLQQGQVEAVCNDDALLVTLAEQDPTTKIVGPRFSNDPYGIGVPRDQPELVRFVNAVLERLRANGTWATIYGRWLSGQLGPPPAPPEAQYLD
ncbi:MAG TPA: glutamate ABC transporter substrate-binding protein [Micromonosporaceae bacterium]|nr:glutamate ABC transporter substrate-binding protein [Micromonosporaceae bacterium]